MGASFSDGWGAEGEDGMGGADAETSSAPSTFDEAPPPHELFRPIAIWALPMERAEGTTVGKRGTLD